MKKAKTIRGYSPEEILFVIHNYGRLTSQQLADTIGEVTSSDVRNLVDRLRKKSLLKPERFYGMPVWRKQAAEIRKAKEEKKAINQFERKVRDAKRIASIIEQQARGKSRQPKNYFLVNS